MQLLQKSIFCLHIKIADREPSSPYMILNQQIIVLNTEVTYYDVNQQLFHKDNCPEFIMPMIDRFKLLNYMKLTAKGSLLLARPQICGASLWLPDHPVTAFDILSFCPNSFSDASNIL
jgi:hypothetical protein